MTDDEVYNSLFGDVKYPMVLNINAVAHIVDELNAIEDHMGEFEFSAAFRRCTRLMNELTDVIRRHENDRPVD